MEETRTFSTKSGQEILLRPASQDDATDIIRTVRSTSTERSYILMEQYGKNTDLLKKFIQDTDRTKNLILVAVSEGTVVGVLEALQADMGIRFHLSHILSIGLHIDESHRGFGIGSEMLDYVISWAKVHDFKKLVASIFTPSKRSLHLFTRAGFTEECTKHKQVRIGREYIDEMCMVMFLED